MVVQKVHKQKFSSSWIVIYKVYPYNFSQELC